LLIIAQPGSHLTQLERSSEGAEPASHVSHSVELNGATWFAAHSAHAPSTIAEPGAHATQLERSAEGAEPASHVSHAAEPNGAT